jgi:hypothetical protein
MAIIEKAKLGDVREDGSQILLPETETVIKNARTEVEYDDDDHAANDVADPNTDTTDDDIQRIVTIRVLKGVESQGIA